MASKRNVGGSRVREFLLSEDGQAALVAAQEAAEAKGEKFPKPLTEVGARGRFSAAQIEVFHKANKRERYTANHVEARKITGTREGSNGRKQTVTVSATLPEVRAWAESPEGIAAGVKVGSRGRIGKDVLSAFAARPRV